MLGLRRVLPVVALVLVVSCGGDDSAASTTSTLRATTTTNAPEQSVHGLVGIYKEDFIGEADRGVPCRGDDSLADMTEGANVVAKNEENKIIGANSLSQGRGFATDGEGFVTDGAGTKIPTDPRVPEGFVMCVFEFQLELAEEAEFYTFEIAGRPTATYSQEQMVLADWEIVVELP